MHSKLKITAHMAVTVYCKPMGLRFDLRFGPRRLEIRLSDSISDLKFALKIQIFRHTDLRFDTEIRFDAHQPYHLLQVNGNYPVFCLEMQKVFNGTICT